MEGASNYSTLLTTTHQTNKQMTYEESFLDTCDSATGIAPAWAIKQIFEEHGSDLADFYDSNKGQYGRENGKLILCWLGY